jgi:acyl-CoA synthetase (AMP-forming)/AMP-acid ligase II
MDVSFGTMWEAIARNLPDAVAICEPGRDYTFAEFDDRAARLAAALASPRASSGSGVINTGGEKVHPQEVEDVLLAYPGVTDASVVGVPDDTWGERVVAVVATTNQALTSEELRAAVRRRLAGYKVPRTVVLLPALPRTPTGKLELARVRGIAAGAENS